MEDKKFVKMSSLVGQEFTVIGFHGYKFKMWIPEESRMHISDTYAEGHRKMYSIETDKGTLDVSQSQMGNLLEGVVSGGEANIIGKTYTVKSNGKTGMEIRYYINPVAGSASAPIAPIKGGETPASSIPEGMDF